MTWGNWLALALGVLSLAVFCLVQWENNQWWKRYRTERARFEAESQQRHDEFITAWAQYRRKLEGEPVQHKPETDN